MQSVLQDLEIEFTTNAAHQVSLFKQSFTSSLTATSTFLRSSLDVIPSGTEQGEYLAIDLGGSNLRCAIVRLVRNVAPVISIIRVWTIPDQHKIGPASNLFTWIATCIAQVVNGHDHNRSWKLGVTFSFPVQETSISSGLIMDMGKTYNLVFLSPEDRCIKMLLNAALIDARVSAEIVICVNDSNATLLSRAHMDNSARMSLVLGTGCNAAMYMQTCLLELTKSMTTAKKEHCFVNCELSLLGKDVLPYTKYDLIINKYEMNRGFQPMEYATTGPWLGELVRLILLDFIDVHGLLHGAVPDSMKTIFSLQTDTLWRIEAADAHRDAQTLLNNRHPQQEKSWTIDEVLLVTQVSKIVTNRSATLIAASLCSLRSFLELEEHNQSLHVACCGSIIEGFPNYDTRVQKCLDSLQANITLVKNNNSGILGAAVGAACISHKT